MQITKTADSKGRVVLGERFANRTVIIREVDETEVVVTLARILPEREAWLIDNESARTSVLRGLEQAKAGEFIDGPDIASDANLANDLEDDA